MFEVSKKNTRKNTAKEATPPIPLHSQSDVIKTRRSHMNQAALESPHNWSRESNLKLEAPIFIRFQMAINNQQWGASSPSYPIFVQQDNAQPQSMNGDQITESHYMQKGWDILMKRQTPNSRDKNLGCFASIQALQHQAARKDVDEFIQAVSTAFYSMEQEKLDNVFVSLQQAMIGVLTVNGDSTSKLNHMSKEMLRRLGLLPVTIRCDPAIVAASRSNLDINNEI